MKINFTSRNINLVGILENKEAKKGIILVHGFLENKDSHHWINLSKKLQKEGFAVFRFDFGGCGESDEIPISISGQIKDLKSAINFVRKKHSLIGVVGHSLGGLCSLELANEFNALVAWAPATDHMIPKSLEEMEKKETKDFFILNIHGKEYSVAKKFIKEREAINQEELIGKIKIPTLIIHGTADKMVPVEQAEHAKKYLKNGEVKIITGENHFFTKKPEETIKMTVEWFKQHL